ncbi:hypothetical protein ACWG8W_06295 [Citricoccus zhacaiensis]
MEKEHYSPNEHKRINVDSPDCVHVMNLTARLMEPVSPEAYALSTYLASWWNDTTGNNVIDPSDERVQASLSITPQVHASAIAELEAKGWWSAVWAEGRIQTYKPIFALNDPQGFTTRLQNIKDHHHGFSMNHAKAVLRYLRSDSIDATAIMLWIVSETKQRAVAMGNRYFQAAVDGETPGKLFHGTFFEHPPMSKKDPETWEEVSGVINLPESWTTKLPKRTLITYGEVSKRVIMSEARYEAALDAIHELGFWTVVWDRDEALLSPTYKLHSLVWEFDHHAGGDSNIVWENERGLGDPRDVILPKLGYHYIYGLVSRQRDDYIMIGQTSQALEHRLNQHLNLATNDDANDAVLSILRDPTDTMKIVKLAEVAFPYVSEVEMMVANLSKEVGQPVHNKILTVAANNRTIRPDRRLGAGFNPQSHDWGPAIIGSIWPDGHLEAWMPEWLRRTNGGQIPFGGRPELDRVLETKFGKIQAPSSTDAAPI